MRIKVNMALQVDDESGNTTDRCSVDLYVNCFNETDLLVMKEGMLSVCDSMKNVINNV